MDDVDELIQVVYGYFTEYGTMQQEQACLRVLQQLRPMPEGVSTLDEWNMHILINSRNSR